MARKVDGCAFLFLALMVGLTIGGFLFGWRPSVNVHAGADGAGVSVRLH